MVTKPFGNGESPNGNSFVCLPVSIWEPPFENRDSKKNGNVISFGGFSSIPKWSQTLYGNGLVTGQSTYGFGDASIPHFHTGIPMWKWAAVSFYSTHGNCD